MASHYTNHQACKRCKRSRAESGGLSARGLCYPCAIEAVTTNAAQLWRHEGPAYKRWLRGYAEAALRLTEEVAAHSSPPVSD